MADTRRDIIEKAQQIGAHAATVAAGMRLYYLSDPAVVGPLKTYVDAVNADVAALTAAMAAFTAAAP